MTGFDEAQEWLKENAPRWTLVHGEAIMVPGPSVGSPTTQRVEVSCVQDIARDPIAGPFYAGQINVRGSGATYLEAVQVAVGVNLRNLANTA